MGVSRKIEDEDERRRLRQILDGLKPPEGRGFIIRTAGVGKTKAEIERERPEVPRPPLGEPEEGPPTTKVKA